MKIAYSSKKDIINKKKHGISLADATMLEWDTLQTEEDSRVDYGETRVIGYAFIEIRLYCVVYTDRDGGRRIISLRKANKREVSNYVLNN